jgi:hypothetical protein
MSAVIAVLTESVTESIKGFYKLRKAYISLDAILAEEKKYLATLQTEDGKPVILESAAVDSPETPSKEPSRVASSTNLADKQENKKPNGEEAEAEAEAEAEEFFDTKEEAAQLTTIKTATETNLSKEMAETDLNAAPPAPIRRLSSHIQEGPDMDIFGANFVDGFIHSSSNFCYGLLLILLSLLPPAFSTLSKIAGFKGDRKQGIALLWQASKFENLNGAFAGLMLLGYYNGFIGFCDILPASGSGAFPRERCVTLLQNFRKRYPKVHFLLVKIHIFGVVLI